jgi:hypothetical protein
VPIVAVSTDRRPEGRPSAPAARSSDRAGLAASRAGSRRAADLAGGRAFGCTGRGHRLHACRFRATCSLHKLRLHAVSEAGDALHRVLRRLG